MPTTHNIKETSELLRFGCQLGKTIVAATGDGKFGFGDKMKVLAALFTSGEAISGIQSVPAELADLDSAEAAELVSIVADEFPGIPQGKTGDVAAGILNLLPAFVGFIQQMRGLSGAPKAVPVP